MDMIDTKRLKTDSEARWKPILAGAIIATLLMISHSWANYFGRGSALWATIPDANIEALELCLDEVREEESDPAEYYRKFPTKYREFLAKMSKRIESELIPQATSAEEIELMRNVLDNARKVGDTLKGQGR